MNHVESLFNKYSFDPEGLWNSVVDVCTCVMCDIVITSTKLFIIIFNVEIACRYMYVHVFFNFSNGTDGPLLQ